MYDAVVGGAVSLQSGVTLSAICAGVFQSRCCINCPDQGIPRPLILTSRHRRWNFPGAAANAHGVHDVMFISVPFNVVTISLSLLQE